VRHPDNNYRLYKLSDVRWLRFVKQAKQLGFSLSEIKEILRDASHGESPCPRVREILRSHIEENRKQIESLFKLQERMEHALDQWDEMPDKMPDGQTVCHLIETIVDVGGVGDD
jgi:DNA-binding transcriptional MerR regulator